jgi:hypothetical protein
LREKAIIYRREVKAVGMWSTAFEAPTAMEKQVQDQYVSIFQKILGISPSQAKAGIRDIIEEAKEESLKEDTSDLPQNVGDFLLEKESSDEKIRSILAKKRREGVRDQDIKWWFNMHDFEIRILLKVDDMNKHALFAKFRKEDGLSEDKAANGVRKSYPLFGDPDDTTHTTGEDRPLPYELKDRINRYVVERMQTDPETFKKEIEQSSTFNALIREEVRKGNI